MKDIKNVSEETKNHLAFHLAYKIMELSDAAKDTNYEQIGKMLVKESTIKTDAIANVLRPSNTKYEQIGKIEEIKTKTDEIAKALQTIAQATGDRADVTFYALSGEPIKLVINLLVIVKL